MEDPYPFYERARREEPVFYSPALRMWYVTRYDDIATVLKDPARFSSAGAVNVPLEYTPDTRRIMETSFLSHSSLTNNDPPSHTNVRRLVNAAFLSIDRLDLQERVRGIANELIDEFAGDGRAEFVKQFSFPLPMRVILSLLGAPEDDVARHKQWADDWIKLLLVQMSPQEQAGTTARLLESERYWLEMIEQRRERPGDDLLSELVRISDASPQPIEPLQMVNTCAVLTLAGHETTTNLLGLCLRRLLSMRDLWAEIVKGGAPVPRIVEETLRADTSVHALMRTTTEAVEIGGVVVPEGEHVALLFASANHDETYFADPARFDPARRQTKRHLAFGGGIHTCVGAPIARMETQVSVEMLARRLPGLRLTPGQEFCYLANPIHRGLQELHIEWDV